ncbi:MAG: response regulator transcription factor [Pseudomonadota bacterium]
MHVLIAEDDQEVSAYLAKGLREAGHTVETFHDGHVASVAASRSQFDVLIIDRMLPGADGLNIIKSLRAAGNHAPTLVLSALGNVDHRVEGLRAGSDDYLSKPFVFSEVLARIEALVRRSRMTPQGTCLQVGDLLLDRLARVARRGDREIELLPREYALLEYLMEHTGQVVTRTMLLEALWGLHFDPRTNIVDVHISRLRQKVDKGFSTALIRTVRGMGYMLRA